MSLLGEYKRRIRLNFVIQPQHRVGVAVACALSGGLCFAITEGLVKTATQRGYPTIEILFIRSVFGFACITTLMLFVGIDTAIRTRYPVQQFMRTIVSAGAIYCFYKAVGLMPLADVTAISFAAPILAAALATFVIKESTPPLRWLALLIGFAGVLVIAQPGQEMLQEGSALIALTGAVLAAFSMLMIRHLGMMEDASTNIFYLGLFMMLQSGAAFAMSGSGIHIQTSDDLLLLAATGGIGALAAILSTLSYRFAAISIVVPFDYTAILYAGLIGFIFFHEVPTLITAAGAALIIAGGLFVVFQEARSRPE